MSVNINGGNGALEFGYSIDDTGFNRGINNMERNAGRFSGQMQRQGDDIQSFAKKAASAAAAYFSIQQATTFVQSMVQVRGEFQQIETAYKTMLGSKEKADALMAESVKLAAVTPFGLKDVAAGSKQLLAYGFAAKDITQNLEMLGNIASGVGSQLGDITYLYGTLRASGRVTQMDINQFAGRGIPIYDALSKSMGINVEQVREYVSAGKVGFPQVEQAFKNLTGAGGMFFNLMQEQSKSLTGQLSNLQDAWDVMLNDLGRSNEGLFSTAIQSAITLIENYQKVIDIIGSLIVTYGAYRVALVTYTVANTLATAGQIGMTAAQIRGIFFTETLTKAQKLLNFTMLSNPYVAVAAALAGLTTYIALASEETLKLKTAAEMHEEAVKEQGNSLQNTEAQLRVYVDMLKRGNLSEVERLSVYNKIKFIDPAILKGIDSKTIAYDKLKTNVDAYVSSLRTKNTAELKEREFAKGIAQEEVIKAELARVKADNNNAFRTGGSSRAELQALKEKRGFVKAAFDEEAKLEDALIKQRIANDNLIKGTVRTGTADEIKAARKDLTELTDLRKRYAKGTQEYQVYTEDILRKETEIKSLRTLKASKDSGTQPAAVKNKDYFDNIVKDNTEKLNALDKGAKDFEQRAAPLKKKIAEAEQNLLGFKVADPAKQQKQELKVDSKYSAMMKQIFDLNEKYNNKSLTSDERKLQEIRNEFKALQSDIDEYNSDPQNKKVNPNLKPALERALADQDYENETELLKVSLDKQKALYADYEDYKTQVGKNEASARYENEIDTSRTFLEKLKGEANALEQDPATMTGPQIERLKYLYTLINEGKAAEKQRYQEAYVAAMTHSQKVEQINEEFRNKAKALGSSITDAQKIELNQQRDQAINSAKDEALVKTEIYKKLADETVLITRAQVQDQIKALEGMLQTGGLPPDVKAKIQSELGNLKIALKIGVDQSNLNNLKNEYNDTLDELNSTDENGDSIVSEDAKKRIIIRLKEIKGEIDAIDNNGDSVASWGDKVAKNFEYFKGSTEDVAKGVSKDLGQMSGSFNELSNSLGGSDTQAGYLLGTIGELLAVGQDAAGAVASFAAGDIIGGVTKTISAVAGLFRMGKKVKEMNAAARKEVQDYYDAAIDGERQYQDSLRDREIQVVRNNKLALQGIRDEFALRKSQSDAYAREASDIMGKLQGQEFIESQTYKHGTWFRKASVTNNMASLKGKSASELFNLLSQGKLEGDTKALVERLKELELKGWDAQEAINELARETSELFTGTTSSNLTDTLLDMFKGGKTGAQDLADFFKTTMDDAALSIFKNKVLAQAMETFYAEFDKAAQSGDELTSDEIARLNGLFTSLTGDALRKFEEFQKITGSNLTDGNPNNSQNSLTAGLKNIKVTPAIHLLNL